jgi:TolA-binding protein
LQDNLRDHAEATRAFEAYLARAKGSAPLRAEALFRLARSLMATGQTQRAKKNLEEVLAKHSGASIAIKARKMLDNLDKTDPGP